MEYMVTFHILNVYFDKTQPHQLKYTFNVFTPQIKSLKYIVYVLKGFA